MHSKCVLPFSSPDFDRIRRTRERILLASRAPNTRASYNVGWRIFADWCRAAGRTHLPASSTTVEDFAVWLIAEGYRLGTVVPRLCAIAAYHVAAGAPSPIDDKVRELLACARRDLQEKPRGKRAISYELLCRLVPLFRDTPAGIRDRAMILLGFASGWRRSELVALHSSHVAFTSAGITLWQPRSKTDQIGEGRLVGIAPGRQALTCPVRALKAWLRIRGDWEGPLFVRMDFRGRPTRQGFEPRGETFHQTLKRELRALGENAREFGAHSLRAGMITEAAKAGASDIAIMQRTGHKCSHTIRRYVRPATVFDFDPLKDVL